MKFFSLAIVAGLFCAVVVSAAPSSMIDDDSMIIDVDSFGVVDDINKAIQSLLEKVKCSVTVIGQVINETDLKKDYVEYKSAVEIVLKNDLKKCAELDGLESKLKCALVVAKKLFKLTADFTQKVEKTNKELAEKIVKSLKSQCFSHEFNLIQMNNEAFEPTIHDDLTFSVTDTITKLLQALLEKVKCSMKAISEVVADSNLLDIFKEFKDDVEKVLQTDVKKCVKVEGLSPKLKCALAVSEKLTKLFAKFAQDVLKENKDVGGRVIKAITQCVQKKEIELFELNEELMDDEVVTFDLAGIMKKVIEHIKKNIKCSIDAVEKIIGDGELRNVFKKFRADLKSLLKNDAKQCLQNKGVIEKLRCVLTVSQKLETLYVNFIREVQKTNKEVAQKVFNALVKCLRGGVENFFISNEDGNDVEIFDGADVITKIIQALIEMVKCSLNSIKVLIKDAKLKEVYEKLKSAVEDILQNDLKKCAETEDKLMCALSGLQKVVKVYGDFVNQVLKIDKELAQQIVKAVQQCLKN